MNRYRLNRIVKGVIMEAAEQQQNQSQNMAYELDDAIRALQSAKDSLNNDETLFAKNVHIAQQILNNLGV